MFSLPHLQVREPGGRAPRKLARASGLAGLFFDTAVAVCSSYDLGQALRQLGFPTRSTGNKGPRLKRGQGLSFPVLWAPGARSFSGVGPSRFKSQINNFGGREGVGHRGGTQ